MQITSSSLINVFLFGILILCILLFWFMLWVVTFPCVTLSDKKSGQPCLSPLARRTGAAKKPLFIIVEVLFSHNILIKEINLLEIPIVSYVLYKNVQSILSIFFLVLFVRCRKGYFFL